VIKYTMYRAHDSFLHRIDPRVKFLLSMFIFVLGILYSDALPLIALFVSVYVILAVGGRIRPRTFVTYIKPILPLIIIMLLLWPFFKQGGTVFFEIWILKVTSAGVLMGIAMAFRILTMISATFILLMTTQQKDIISALTQMGLPYDYGLTLVIALRYVPTLAGMAQTIMDAQRSRGLELDKGSLIERIKKYVPILAPLIVGAIRMAQELAIAIDSRGFGHGQRTYINVLVMSRRDILLFVMIIAVFVVLVYARFWGLGVPGLL